MSYQPNLFCGGCGHRGGWDYCEGILCGDCLASEMMDEEDMEPVYATLHFYYNDPESMSRFHRIQQVDDAFAVLFDFDMWLRGRIKYADNDELCQIREEFWKICNDYGISPWEE